MVTTRVPPELRRAVSPPLVPAPRGPEPWTGGYPGCSGRATAPLVPARPAPARLSSLAVRAIFRSRSQQSERSPPGRQGSLRSAYRLYWAGDGKAAGSQAPGAALVGGREHAPPPLAPGQPGLCAGAGRQWHHHGRECSPRRRGRPPAGRPLCHQQRRRHGQRRHPLRPDYRYDPRRQRPQRRRYRPRQQPGLRRQLHEWHRLGHQWREWPGHRHRRDRNWRLWGGLVPWDAPRLRYQRPGGERLGASGLAC
ncbi:MAG: hypothetical protein KatS3mg061_1061 [Dehalococcoidia bacterium]|nr:MAG: hypothetical protein KatS3mg061_1061 [Dehalococcoidia bacterium]